jgi:hypothetical protein
MTKTQTKSYHIYLNEKCLFKNLNEEEFHIIWSKLYTSYWDDELTYTEITNEDESIAAESSY